MDHTTTALDAQFDTLDAAGMPELAPFARETATDWPEELPAAPLPQDEEQMDQVIFAALISPYV